MLFYSSLCFCVLISISSSLTKDELLSKIGNRHMLTAKDASSLINAEKPNLYEEYIARDCRAAQLRGRRQSGLYVIRPKYSPLLAVYCDMKYDGGGWTVLHRNNANTKTAWSKPWHSYKRGFGDLQGNHWLGNQYMHLLTNQNAFSVRFVIIDSKGQTKYAEYQSFKVDDEDSGYALRLGNYTGDAGDSLTTVGESGTHDNMRFSTEDKDNDRRASTNCALDNGGGWWYDNCYSALLTGDIRWNGLCSEAMPCTLASIMIRPSGKNCNIPPRY